MIKFEIEKTGRIRKSDGVEERLVTYHACGDGVEIERDIYKFLEITNKKAHEPFMCALEHFFKEEMSKFEGEDDE